MSNSAGENIRLVTDAQGRLLFVRAFPGRTPAETAWTCLWTAGHRSLDAATGTCVHDGTAERMRQIVQAAKARVRETRRPASARIVSAAARACLAPGTSPEDRLAARFVEACGPATARKALIGAPSEALAHLDERFGGAVVDRVFATCPLLAALALHPGAASLNVELAHAFAAHGGPGLPEALVALARRIGDFPLTGPTRGWDATDLDPDLDLYLDRELDLDLDRDLDFGIHGQPLPRLYQGEEEFDNFEDDPDDPDEAFDLGEAETPRTREAVRVSDLPGLPRGEAVACAALLDRLGLAEVPVELAPALVRETAWIPRDWLPRDADAAAACAFVLSLAAEIALESGGTLAPRDLVAPAKGRWRAYADQLARIAPQARVPEPAAWQPGSGRGLIGARAALVIGVRDMVRRFSDQLGRPLAAALTAGSIGPVEAAVAIERRTWRTLFRDKGLAAVLQASADWHARRAEIDRLVRTLSDGREWPRPFPDLVASNGVIATPLLSARELAEEGAALQHCVGDYADACIRGESVIVSLRHSVDGTETRSSTLELAWTPELQSQASQSPPEILQHRGPLNGPPPAADVTAAAELIARIALGNRRAGLRLPLRARAAALAARLEARARHAGGDAFAGHGRRPWGDPDGRRLADTCGYDWREPAQLGTALNAWGPFLPRDLRADPVALLAALGVTATGVAEEEEPRRPRLRLVRLGWSLARLGLFGAGGRGRRLGAVRSRLESVLKAVLIAMVLLGAAFCVLLGLAALLAPSKAELDRGRDLASRLSRAVTAGAVTCPPPVVGPYPAPEACGRLDNLFLRLQNGVFIVDFDSDGVPPVRILRLSPGSVPEWGQPTWEGYLDLRLEKAGLPSASAMSDPLLSPRFIPEAR